MSASFAFSWSYGRRPTRTRVTRRHAKWGLVVMYNSYTRIMQGTVSFTVLKAWHESCNHAVHIFRGKTIKQITSITFSRQKQIDRNCHFIIVFINVFIVRYRQFSVHVYKSCLYITFYKFRTQQYTKDCPKSVQLLFRYCIIQLRTWCTSLRKLSVSDM